MTAAAGSGPTPGGPLIDLGEVGGPRRPAAPDADPDAAPPPRRLRGAGLLLAAALAGLAGGAAAAPTGPALTESTVPRERADRVYAVDDALYLIGGWPGDPPTRVTARGLPDGAPRWHAVLPDVPRVTWVFRRAGVLLLLVQPDPPEADVQALDADTGAALWRRPGALLGYAEGPGGATLGVLRTPASAPSPAEVTVTAVELRSGAVAWSLRAPAESAVEVGFADADADADADVPGSRGGAAAPPRDPAGLDGRTLSRVVVGLPTGRVEIHDPGDGRLVGSLSPPPRRGGLPAWLAVSGDLALVQEPGDPAVVAGYDLGRRTRRWAVPWDAQPLGAAGLAAHACGPLICLARPDRTRVALDGATGTTRWTGRWHWLEPVAGQLVGAREPGGELAVVDPASGAVRRQLGGWRLFSAPPVGEAIFVWTDPPRSRTWLGRLDPGTGRVVVLGRTENLLFECHPGRDSVVCRRADGSLGIWRYR